MKNDRLERPELGAGLAPNQAVNQEGLQVDLISSAFVKMMLREHTTQRRQSMKFLSILDRKDF